MCQYIFKFSVSCMLSDKKSSFRWRLVVVYSSPYDEGKPEFIDDLYMVLSMWQGPTVIGGGASTYVDFPLIKAMIGSIKKWLTALMTGLICGGW
jgi:hypothetical protein